MMKKINAFLLPLSIIFCFVACHKNTLPNNNCVENPKPDCFCTQQYDPVCGCNNKTYGNACEAACQGITEFKQGACPK